MMTTEIEASDFQEGDMLYVRDVGYATVKTVGRTSSDVTVGLVCGHPSRDAGEQFFNPRDKVFVRR